jgi:CheY-like chemotaxis protein
VVRFFDNARLDLSKGDLTMAFPAVLCVDHTPKAFELRKKTLESHGYRVKLASTSHAAIKMLEESSVAAVLLEYKHEGMNAEDVACDIKQQFPTLPIILLSSHPEFPERLLWLVDEYVMKSELADGLVPIIERATHRASSHPNLSEGFPHGKTAA